MALVESPLATPAARRARARILELARLGPADPAFLRDVSEQLRRIVPFTGSFWAAGDPLTALPAAPARVDLPVVTAGLCERFWEREFRVQDVNLFRDLARAACPVAALYRAAGGRPERSVRYRELRRAEGFGDELRGVFRSGGAPWGFVALWRDAGQPPFSLAEEKALTDLGAPIAAAFRRAALLRAAGGETPEAPGLLVFDARGELESVNDQAAAWLRELPPTAPPERHASGPLLPTELLAVVALARAIGAGVEGGVARARLRSRRGRWLVVHGFALRGPARTAGRTAVVIEPAEAAEVAPIIVEAYDLGPREQQITQLIARGLGTAEIAQRLCLSRHTVRDYVKRVFEKVGVTSRGELVARLFAEHYAAPFQDSVAHAPPGGT